MERLLEAMIKKARCLEVKPMDAPCWQCAHTHIAINPSVFGETRDNSHYTTSLLAWSSISGLFLSPKLKVSLKGRRFESIVWIKEHSLADLRSIPNEAFQKCFEGWKKRWERCIQSGGDYFEGDKAE
jgi:hypothetical protein